MLGQFCAERERSMLHFVPVDALIETYEMVEYRCGKELEKCNGFDSLLMRNCQEYPSAVPQSPCWKLGPASLLPILWMSQKLESELSVHRHVQIDQDRRMPYWGKMQERLSWQIIILLCSYYCYRELQLCKLWCIPSKMRKAMHCFIQTRCTIE